MAAMSKIVEDRFAGGRLYCRHWDSPGVPVAQAVLSHGFAEHCGRYDHVAAALNTAGVSVWALDHRGHGRSQGDRADIGSVASAVADLDLFVDVVRKSAPGGPLYLVGHSMGGLIAAAYAEEHQDRLAGLILSGALLYVAPEVAALADLAEIPDLGLADAVSSDPAVVESYKQDPLVFLGPPPRNFVESFAQVEDVRARLNELTLPILAMHGSADLLVSPQALRDLVSSVSSEDLTAILWPGLWHEIFNEPRQADVLSAMTAWIRARL
jgi:acylglycerol lipase